MVIEMPRGGNSFLRALNRRYIYGRIPLLHSLIFLVEMLFVAMLTRRFNSLYAARPVLTTMVTNALLGGVADTVAQSLTSIRRRSNRIASFNLDDAESPAGLIQLESFTSTKKDSSNTSTRAVDDDVDFVLPGPDARLKSAALAPAPFDFERLIRFVGYGFLMAPVQHKWFSFLSATFPLGMKTKVIGTIKEGLGLAPGGATGHVSDSLQALKRVAMDQLMFAPVGLALFFTFMTVAEGGGRRAITRKFQDVYVPALKANFMVWPAVQMLNFRVIPLQFQIPFVSTVGIAWTAYLSMTNSSS